MRLPIQRIDHYRLPATGSVTQDVEAYVSMRVGDILSDLPEDPMLEVAGTPRGDYVEVMIFTGKPDIKVRLEESIDIIRHELRAMGVTTAFYIQTGVEFAEHAERG